MAAMKKSSNVKYLGYGLMGGIAIAVIIALFLVLLNGDVRAMLLPPTNTPTPLPTFTPTATFTSTPTPIATATFTSTPTFVDLAPSTAPNTPTPPATLTIVEQKILNGEMLITGPLTQAQQIQLYNSSIAFIALTTKESIQIGEQFTGIGFGSPTLICGPLSGAILQTAGLLEPEIVPFDFWLLNPFVSKDRALLNRAFPSKRYEDYDSKTPINEFKFSDFPLLPGDFLYIRHGSWGNFDHFMVVNRVDAAGRAYSVTNYNTAQGFIINETMLYDPNDPSVGIFRKWTEKKFAVSGSTGFGGFELWRLRAP